MASYTPVSVSSYNSSPPVDNGTVTATNKISWSTIKTKLSGPLNTAIASLNTNIGAAVTTITSNLSSSNSTLSTHQATYTALASVLYAPSGTVALFVQTTPPTGWTKGATHDDKMLRLVSGAVSTGGSTAFSSILTSRTITSSNMPAHDHSWSASATTAAGTIALSRSTFLISAAKSGSTSINGGGSKSYVSDVNVSSEAISATVSVSGTADSAGSGTAMDFAVKYVDVIMATKD